MDPTTVGLWIQVGSQLFQVGEAAFEKIRQFLTSGEDVTADDAALDAAHVEYQRRIAQATQEAGDPPTAA